MEPKQDKTVMPWILANAYGEEPDALIALVRVCGGATRVTGGSTRKTWLLLRFWGFNRQDARNAKA